MPNQYETGQQVEVWVIFQVGGEDTDPDTVELRIRGSDDTVTSYDYPADLDRTAEGHYRKILSPADGEEGFYHYKWYGTGACKIAKSGYYEVVTDQFD